VINDGSSTHLVRRRASRACQPVNCFRSFSSRPVIYQHRKYSLSWFIEDVGPDIFELAFIDRSHRRTRPIVPIVNHGQWVSFTRESPGQCKDQATVIALRWQPTEWGNAGQRDHRLNHATKTNLQLMNRQTQYCDLLWNIVRRRFEREFLYRVVSDLL